MEADKLSSEIWNAIADMVVRSHASREILYSRVKKRDLVKKVIWVAEFTETAIPLVAFTYGFAYYDTQVSGSVLKRYDASGADTDPAFQTKIIVPRVGQMAAILDPQGTGRFPVCVGVIQSENGSYWQGEGG